MGYKSTRRVTREQALSILTRDLPNLPNSTLETLLDAVADSGHSHIMSRLDNFAVTEFVDECSAGQTSGEIG